LPSGNPRVASTPMQKRQELSQSIDGFWAAEMKFKNNTRLADGVSLSIFWFRQCP